MGPGITYLRKLPKACIIIFTDGTLFCHQPFQNVLTPHFGGVYMLFIGSFGFMHGDRLKKTNISPGFTVSEYIHLGQFPPHPTGLVRTELFKVAVGIYHYDLVPPYRCSLI